MNSSIKEFFFLRIELFAEPASTIAGLLFFSKRVSLFEKRIRGGPNISTSHAIIRILERGARDGRVARCTV